MTEGVILWETFLIHAKVLELDGRVELTQPTLNQQTCVERRLKVKRTRSALSWNCSEPELTCSAANEAASCPQPKPLIILCVVFLPSAIRFFVLSLSNASAAPVL